MSIWDWASKYHDTIEALAALGALVAALLLFLITAALWWATRRLATSTEDLAKGADAQATQQSRANDIAAQGNQLAALALDEAVKDHKLNWHMWVADNRPRIRVRRAEHPPLYGGVPLDSALEITNLGEADANLMEIWSDVGRLDGRGIWMSPKPDLVQSPLPANTIIKCGERPAVRVRSRHVIDELALQAADMADGFGGSDTFPALRLMGEIVYSDPAGGIRRTGFMFLWNPQSSRWEENAPPDPEFQYEN